MDGIENEYKNDLTVIRLNIQEPMTRELADKMGFEFTPTFIFFDSDGIEQYRSVGNIDSAKIGELIR